MLKKISKYYHWIIFLLFIVSTLILIRHSGFEVIQSILSGVVVSSVFYFLVDFAPSYIEKQNIRRAFLSFYDNEFKEDVLREVLTLAEFKGKKHEKIEELKDPEKFKVFSKEDSKYEDRDNWHAVTQNIGEERYQHSLDKIITRLSDLHREIDFLTRTVSIENEELLKKMRRLSRVLQGSRVKRNIDWDREEDKDLANLLFELFSGWNLVDGDHGDFVKSWAEEV